VRRSEGCRAGLVGSVKSLRVVMRGLGWSDGSVQNGSVMSVSFVALCSVEMSGRVSGSYDESVGRG